MPDLWDTKHHPSEGLVFNRTIQAWRDHLKVTGQEEKLAELDRHDKDNSGSSYNAYLSNGRS